MYSLLVFQVPLHWIWSFQGHWSSPCCKFNSQYPALILMDLLAAFVTVNCSLQLETLLCGFQGPDLLQVFYWLLFLHCPKWEGCKAKDPSLPCLSSLPWSFHSVSWPTNNNSSSSLFPHLSTRPIFLPLFILSAFSKWLLLYKIEHSSSYCSLTLTILIPAFFPTSLFFVTFVMISHTTLTYLSCYMFSSTKIYIP